MGVWTDVRYAIRGLQRTPAISLLAVLSLAVGMGANVAVFSLVDALMLRRLPVDHPDRLVTLEQIQPNGSRSYNLALQDAERFEQIPQVFAGVSATTWADGYNIASGGQIDESLARISIVSGTFFETIGLRATIGRALQRDDDRVQGDSAVVVISDSYWRRRFQRAPDVVGRTLTLNGTTYSIIGVTPRGFNGDWVGWPTDLWIPVAMAAQVYAENGTALPRGLNRQYKILARLAPGVPLDHARAPAETIYRQLQRDSPRGSGVSQGARLDLVSAAAGYSQQRESFAQPLTMLLAAVGAVLLIACANVANLLLMRQTTSGRERAIQLAIGARRSQLIRRVFAEGLVLAAAAALAGLLIAAWAGSFAANLARSGPVGTVNFGAQLIDLDIDLNLRMVGFTIVLGVVATVLFAMLPALRASDVSLLPALTGHDSGSGRERWSSPRRLLVVVQLALSLVLLIASGLLVRSLINMRSQDLGFDRGRLLLAWTLPTSTGRRGPALVSFWTDVQQRIESVPGVRSVSASSEGLLPGGPAVGPPVRLEGTAIEQAVRAEAVMTIAPRFFATVGQPVLRGREFSAQDGGSSRPVAIVSESLAKALFSGAEPVGRRLVLGGTGPVVEVVGVVGDAAHRAPRASHQRMVYYPAAQNSGRLRWMCLVVKTAGDPATVAARVRQELRSMDPSLPILGIDTIDEQLDAVLFQDRLLTNLAVAFAVVASILASAGLCGLMSYAIARRTKEIGVRMALGADGAAVLRMILLEALWLVIAGVVIATPLTIAATRLIDTRLFGLTAGDPPTIAAAVVMVVTTALLAAAAPAWRAIRVNPLLALRHD